ncbi:DUF2806 domain-containing protein [Candidatus Saccharibacteria bacterium]|nr:DUF2806 domain-containing protein [Candidatus Saccharibacteria bacterium]
MKTTYVEEEESLQDLWAKLLARESASPETFSMGTLETVKLMSKDDAAIFSQLTKCMSSYNNKVFLFNQEDLYEKYGITYENLMRIEELGLICISPFLSLKIKFPEAERAAIYTKEALTSHKANG